MAQGPGYAVKSVEPVAIGSDVQARVFTLAPGEEIPVAFPQRGDRLVFRARRRPVDRNAGAARSPDPDDRRDAIASRLRPRI